MTTVPIERKATAQDISDRLGGKKQGKGYQAPCPCHDDKHASLSIADSDNGKLLLYCHAGCKYQDIADKLGIPQAQATNGKRQAAVYQYRDRSGKVAHETVRFVLPNGDKSFSQRHQNGNGMVWNLTGATLYPYRLSEMLAARAAGHNVYICEGEKDADSLVRLGFVATTNPMGANKPKVWAEIATHFAGVDAVIVPDNDKAGQDNIAVIATAVKPFAKSISVAKVAAPYKDVTDLIEACGGDALGDLLDSIVEWKPTLDVRQAVEPAPKAATPSAWFVEKTLSDLRNAPQPVYLTPQVQERSLGTIFGPSETFKTFYVINRQIMPVLLAGRKVWFVSGETDDHDLVLRFGAYCEHHKIDPKTFEDRLRFFTVPVYLMQPEHVAVFIAAIKDFAPDLIVIDTLAVCELGGDENSTRDMNIMMDACRRIIRETGAAVALIHHTGKNGDRERGSYALRAQCDWMIELSGQTDGTILVTDSKRRNASKFEPLSLAPVKAGESLVLLPSGKVVQTVADKLTPVQRSVLEALALPTFDQGAKVAELSKLVPEIKSRDMYRVLGKLIDLGFVRKDGRFDPYIITTDGSHKVSQKGPVN